MNVCYDRVMSFGSMCSTAVFLRDNGFRTEATIFDWLVSNIKSNFEMLDDGFAHFLDKEYLSQPYKSHPTAIENNYYHVNLSHMFDEFVSFDKQYKKIQAFTTKRINRFLYNLKNYKCLLVYYAKTKEDFDWINANEETIKEYSKKYNFDIIFVTHEPLKEGFAFPNFITPTNSTHVPYGGEIAFPFENTEPLKEYISAHFIKEEQDKNKKHKEKRPLRRRLEVRFRKYLKVKLKL